MQSFVSSCSAVCHFRPAAVSISTTGEAVTGTEVRGLAAAATNGPKQAHVAPIAEGSSLKTVKLPREQKPLDIEEAISLANKVKDYFQNEGHAYNLLLHILNPHMTMNKSTAEVLPEMAAICGNQDLVEQFVRFLSQDAATTRTPEPTSSSHKGGSSVIPTERKPQRKKKVKGCDSDPKPNLGVDLDGHEHIRKSGDGEKETGGSDRSHQMLESLSKEGNGAIHMKRKRGDRESEDEPEMYMRLVESQRAELDASVLNDVWVSSAFTASKKKCMTKSDERQNQHEDDLKTIKQVKECLEKMSNKTISIANAFHMDRNFTVASIRCIEKVYGDYGLDVIDLLQENSERVLPIILTRLQQKEIEWKRYHANI